MTSEPIAMDVYMQGINFSVNKHQLDAELAKIFHRAPYAESSTVTGPVNFHVYLFKGRDGGSKAHSGSGSLTLLRNVALRFLQEYGEPGNKILPLKTFKIGGRRVKFYPGKSTPRAEVVERILRFPYADPRVAEQKEQRANILQAGSVRLRTLQFGLLCRDSVFSVEWETDMTGGALAVNDERREFRIKMLRATETLYVAIRLSRISYVQVHSDPSTRISSIFFELYGPPNFESEVGAGPRQRLSYLPFLDHQRVAPFTSMAIRLICSSRSDLSQFERLAKTAGIKNIYENDMHVESPGRGLYSAEVLSRVRTEIKALRWNVAFQVEALHRDIALDSREILSIIAPIRELIHRKGRTYTAEFLRHFSAKARYWNAYEQTSQTIQELFAQSEAEYSKFHATALLPDDSSIVWSLHVIITPTKIRLEGPFASNSNLFQAYGRLPILERSNRVLRSFPKRHDYFLRVSFEDEGGMKYRFDKEIDCVAFTRRRVGEFLIDKGLTIAGRRFDFLAYSQSALKEHAVWFVRSFRNERNELVTAQTIIANLGSFDGLAFDPKLRFCPARYAARISQAFTATDSTTVEVEEVIYIKEISDAATKYHFTDGVGTMSLELANAIWDELSASRRRKRRVKNHPRAYQIRWAGCKGMLSVDYQLKGHVMCIRPSMRKFDAANSTTIEIAKSFDKPGAYFLNRPLIMLLEGLGIPFEVFKGYQDTAVAEVQRSTTSLRAFARMLEIHGLGTAYKLTSILLALDHIGLDNLPGNKFYQKMLDFAVHHVLRLLKTKARIPIKEGVTVVGVADVHQHLREGEIFVCTREPDSNKLYYLEGDVLISRSPTIHPGDVQLATAIGKPPPGSCFNHEPLPNTVVFSVLGKRPLASCCGGGDLDGDVYNIIPLNKCPEFSPTRTYVPGDYTPATRRFVDHPSTMIDVAEFVIEYINSDVLGMVAVNWLLIADSESKGILHPDCMRLAALHSDAVDYPKTGQPVALNTIPKPKLKSRPDWHAPEIGANIDEFYKSQRAIGKLFRAIKLPDIKPGISPFERKMIKEGRLAAPRVDDLADTLSGIGLEDDPMVMAIQAHVARFISTNYRPPETMEYVSQIFNRYSSEFQGLCISHTLSQSKAALLSEEEAVVGTIIAKTSQPRKRQELIAGLREKSDLLVKSVKEELMGDDDVSWDECLMRAWLSFELAIELAHAEHPVFGAQSFIWITLGAILDAVKELEDEAKASRASRSTRESGRRY